MTQKRQAWLFAVIKNKIIKKIKEEIRIILLNVKFWLWIILKKIWHQSNNIIRKIIWLNSQALFSLIYHSKLKRTAIQKFRVKIAKINKNKGKRTSQMHQIQTTDSFWDKIIRTLNKLQSPLNPSSSILLIKIRKRGVFLVEVREIFHRLFNPNQP